MKELVEVIAKALVDNPSEVVVTEKKEGKNIVIELHVAQSDMGKVIGKTYSKKRKGGNGQTQTPPAQTPLENGTVTICHSRTKDLKTVTKRADILVVAIGKPNFITKDMVKENSVKATVLFLLPVMGLFALYSKDIIRIFYEGGNFDENSTNITGLVLRFYSLGMLGYALNEVINKSFYAMQKSKITMNVALVTIIINTVCSFAFYKIWGISGLAVSTSIATNIAAIILMFLIKKYVKEIEVKNILHTLLKALASTIVSLMVSYFVYSALGVYITGKLTNLFVMCGVGLVCVGVYVVLLFLLKVKEIYELKKIFVKEK